MSPRALFLRIGLATFLLSSLGCDDVPTNPVIPDRYRVALVTAARDVAEGREWTIYEIDELGRTKVIKQSPDSLRGARYTSYRGTDGAVAHYNADGELVIRDLETGKESVLVGSFEDAAFSYDGTMIAYVRDIVDTSGTHKQLFVLDRTNGADTPVTQNECNAAAPVNPCAFSTHRPLFGSQNELYMVRRLRAADGKESVSLSVFSSSQLERRYVIEPASERDIFPRSHYQNAVLADYVKNPGTPDPPRGFYAVAARTGAVIENAVDLRYTSYCHDATIAGLTDAEIRFVAVSGDEIARLPLPAEYGSDILEVHCSVFPKIE